MKLGRNDPCWCGSKKKFKRCHWGREEEAPVSEGQYHSGIRKIFSKKRCVHPEAPKGCNKIVKAHTLQRLRTIEKITNENKQVLHFSVTKRDSQQLPEVERLGPRVASTFLGFCDNHDKIFTPIEASAFSGDPLQCALIGYRAICHEFYQKTAAVESEEFMRTHLDRGAPIENQLAAQQIVGVQAAGARKGLEDIAEMKRIFDPVVVSKETSPLSSCSICFKGPLSVVSTGLVHTDFTLTGDRLQNLADISKPMEGVAYGVVGTDEGGVVVFSWPSSFSVVHEFIDNLLSFDEGALPSIIVQFMFAYVSNTFFSEDWYDSLQSDSQQHLARLAGEMIQYGSGVNLIDRKIVEWEITKVSKIQ